MAHILYEHPEGTPVPDDAIDGMEGMLGEDTLETDWDLEEGTPPPPGFWRGTHNRDGSRIPGFSEEEYKEGESWEAPQET